jgi:hypothetical protein
MKVLFAITAIAVRAARVIDLGTATLLPGLIDHGSTMDDEAIALKGGGMDKENGRDPR